jgi:hypothetical protein
MFKGLHHRRVEEDDGSLRVQLWQPKMFPTTQEAVNTDADLPAVPFHKSGEPVEGRNQNMEDYKHP